MGGNQSPGDSFRNSSVTWSTHLYWEANEGPWITTTWLIPEKRIRFCSMWSSVSWLPFKPFIDDDPDHGPWYLFQHLYLVWVLTDCLLNLSLLTCICLHIFTMELLVKWSVSRSVESDSLQPHGLQLTRLLSPPLSSRVCSNSCP